MIFDVCLSLATRTPLPAEITESGSVSSTRGKGHGYLFMNTGINIVRKSKSH